VEWFKTGLNPWFMDQISSKSFLENPYFDGEKISKEFSDMIHSKNANDLIWKYWSYIHINWWMNSKLSN
jgi:hypothetical protein